MAITIRKTPFSVQPSGNNSIWQIESTLSTIAYFNVEVFSGSTIISTLKYYPRPENVRMVSFNLSNVLKNLVDSKVDNNVGVIVSRVLDSDITYNLKITEILKSGSTGSTTTTGSYTVWDAHFDRLMYSKYNQFEFNANVNQNIKFLSTKGQVSYQSATSCNLLYFLNSNSIAKKVRIRYYNTNGVQNNLIEVPIVVGNLVRINCSPKTLNQTSGIDFSITGSYKVDLLNSSNSPISEEKLYILKANQCSLNPINLIYKTSLGNHESFEFFNPIETVSNEKTYLKQNILQVDRNGEYSDSYNGVLNSDNKIINVNSTSTFKVFSNPLTDYESIQLKELINSTDVYVELTNDTLVPVSIKDDSYQITQRKTNGNKANRAEFTFTSMFIPSDYSTGLGTELTSAMIHLSDLPLPVQSSGGIVFHDSSGGTLII